VKLVVTTEIGPRVLAYQAPGGDNLLRAFPEQMGCSGEPEYQVRGGHRLWAAPETDLTYEPDNGPVEVFHPSPETVRLSNLASTKWGVRKDLTISVAPHGSAVTLRHKLTNEGSEPREIASWGLTVMAPGGWHLIPQPPLGAHGDDLLPDRVVVPWTYTDFSDDRWRFGKRFWQLHPTLDRPATKMGFALRTGWVAFVLPSQAKLGRCTLFLKCFGYEEGAHYPDLGCNYETFSRSDFLEIETLSPLRRLEHGQSVGHVETWHLFGDIVEPPALDDAMLEEWLQPFLAKIQLT
jgi:hypothetical protein